MDGYEKRLAVLLTALVAIGNIAFFALMFVTNMI